MVPQTRPKARRSTLRTSASVRLLRSYTEGTSNDAWRDEAACLGLDVTWFYPDPDDALGVVRAQTFCASCPVRRDCARHAVEHNERHGVWGGSTEQERAAFRRAMSL